MYRKEMSNSQAFWVWLFYAIFICFCVGIFLHHLDSSSEILQSSPLDLNVSQYTTLNKIEVGDFIEYKKSVVPIRRIERAQDGSMIFHVKFLDQVVSLEGFLLEKNVKAVFLKKDNQALWDSLVIEYLTSH